MTYEVRILKAGKAAVSYCFPAEDLANIGSHVKAAIEEARQGRPDLSLLDDDVEIKVGART